MNTAASNFCPKIQISACMCGIFLVEKLLFFVMFCFVLFCLFVLILKFVTSHLHRYQRRKAPHRGATGLVCLAVVLCVALIWFGNEYVFQHFAVAENGLLQVAVAGSRAVIALQCYVSELLYYFPFFLHCFSLILLQLNCVY